MPIRTVFFDMGGTIDTFWYSPEMRIGITPGLQELLSKHSIELKLTDKQLYELITKGLIRYHQWRLKSLEELPASQVWREYILADYPDKFPQLDTVGDELMVWLETHYYQRQMRPELPAVLENLQSSGYKIGLISNVNSLGQVPLNLKQYGIFHYFNPIILSSEYKRRKPDPAIFHHAARLSGTPTSECIYIGDRIARDVLGARRAGYKLAIQIQHDFKHGEDDEGAVPDHVLKDMHELLAVLKSAAESDCSRPQANCDDGIRAVLFDADGVLYYRKNKEQEYQQLFSEFGQEDVEIPEALKEKYRRMASIGQITFEEYKQQVLQAVGITDPRQLARGIQIAHEFSNRVHFFEDSRATLDQLKNRNLYLGIVTDTSRPLHEKIEKLERGGIGDLWDTIIASREVGVQKPDVRIYALALQQLSILPSQAIFVGHKAIELEGARNAGIRTVAFNFEAGAKADYYIDRFSELLHLPIMN